MNYKTTRWKRKREVILKRDEYLCQECKRYGRDRTAETVHHITPATDAPGMAYKGDNLISLCSECHDAMHDRTNGKLTEKGEALRTRTMYAPPPTK